MVDEVEIKTIKKGQKKIDWKPFLDTKHTLLKDPTELRKQHQNTSEQGTRS